MTTLHLTIRSYYKYTSIPTVLVISHVISCLCVQIKHSVVSRHLRLTIISIFQTNEYI